MFHILSGYADDNSVMQQQRLTKDDAEVKKMLGMLLDVGPKRHF